MRNRYLILGAALLGFFLPVNSAPAYDEAEADKIAQDMKEYGFKEVTTKEGLVFRIPSDMPIEKRAGMLSPVPFDEYLYIKFKKIEEKVNEVDKKLSETDKKIDKLNETLESVKKMMEKETPLSNAPKS